ncbi:MAG: glycosyltransferase [Opitutales bacterium]|nr:glycosyltransferase [Opitutales bacterium]
MKAPILIIQDQLRNGGTERQSLLLAAALKVLGEDARLLLFSPGGRLADEPEQLGIPCRILQKRDIHLPLWAPGLLRVVREIQPGIIICMGRTANCYAGWLQDRLARIPVVGSLRTGKSILPLQRASWKKVVALFVNCHWWKAELTRRGLDPQRVYVHHNPLSRMPTPAAGQQVMREDLRNERGIGQSARVFLNVATFRGGKRHLQLIDQVARWHGEHPGHDWQLWFVGEGRSKVACERRVRSLGLSERIWFAGYQHHVNAFYAAADIAVSYSVEDALPNFLIEAQANRLPVLALDYRGVAECVYSGRSGWILPADADGSYRDKLEEMVCDPEGCRKMGAEGAELALARFNPDQQLQAWIRDLRKVRDRFHCCR